MHVFNSGTHYHLLRDLARRGNLLRHRRWCSCTAGCTDTGRFTALQDVVRRTAIVMLKSVVIELFLRYRLEASPACGKLSPLERPFART